LEGRARPWGRPLGPPAKVRPSRSMVGGGSLPEEGLPTRVLALPGEGAWLLEVARRLRLGEPPVVGRIEADALLLDPRTVDPRHDPLLVAALRAALARP